MELPHLRYFIAAAESENISRAALKLHVSQPGVSRQIRDLEEEIGFQLFERGAKSLKLTTAGKVFFTEARAVIQRADEAVKKGRAAADNQSGELQVGYAPSLTARMLPLALRAFQARCPNVRVKLHDLSTGEMLTGLRDGKLHIGLMARPTRSMLHGLKFQELTRDPLRLAVGPKHRFAEKETVSLADAAKEPFVGFSRTDYPEARELLAASFASVKAKLRIVEEHDSVTSLIASVEAGAGVALVGKSLECISGTRVKLLPLSPEPKPLIVGAAWHKEGFPSSGKNFLAEATTAAKASF
jgi:DNA-binding transcriptional LysR family regulator